MRRTIVVAGVVAALSLSFVASAGDLADIAAARARSAKTVKKKTDIDAAVIDAWKRLPKKGNSCADADLSFDYGVEGGMRNFYCRARGVFSWSTFKKLAPSPFRKGPHTSALLDLHNERQFGFYDPKFVQFAVDHFVPAADDDALRAATQGTYDLQVRNLARLYHVVDLVLRSEPGLIERERRAYLGALDAATAGGNWNNFELTAPYEELLGTAEQDWGGYDPNLVRASTMWWLRRHHDGTASQWRDGLTKLLATYDASWLKSAKAPKTVKLPKR